MVTYRGYKTQVQYVSETSYGSGGSIGSAIKGKLQNVTLNHSNNFIRTTGLGDGRNETFVGWGNYEATWSMEYEISDFDFLQYGVGVLGGAGSAADPYFLEEADFRSYSGTGLKSFKLEVASKDRTGGTDDVDTAVGCVINTIGISLELGASVKCTLSGFAKKILATNPASSFTASTTKPWIFSQGRFKWDGTSIRRIQSATINVNNNYDPDMGREIGSRFPEEMEPGLRKYDWTLVVKMQSDLANSMRDDFYGMADQPYPGSGTGTGTGEPAFKDIIFDLSQGDASGSKKAQIKLSDNAVNDISKPINIGENLVELTLNGSAKKATTDINNKLIKWWTVS